MGESSVLARVRRVRRLLNSMERLEARTAELATQVEKLAARHNELLGATRLRGSVEAGSQRWELAPVAEVRDTVNLLARRMTMRSRVRVVFLAHLPGAWDSLHQLVVAMRDHPDFEPVVISIPCGFKGTESEAADEVMSAELTARGIEHLRLGRADESGLRMIKYLAPDVIFRQSQWDADVSTIFGVNRLAFARLALIPYETVNIIDNVRDASGRNTAVDSDLHRAAWRVFASPAGVVAAREFAGPPFAEKFRGVGHPKIDRLVQVEPCWPGRERQATRVVWSAHHSIGTGWTDVGAFPQMREYMLGWARARPDLDFLFMPHPALIPFTKTPRSPISQDEMTAWLASWCALPNTSMLVDTDYMPALAASDVMITDGLSMLVEYQALGKPLVYVEREGHRAFNQVGERLRSGWVTVPDAADIRGEVERLLDSPDDVARLVAAQRRNIEAIFGSRRDAVDQVLAELSSDAKADRAGHVD